jgi:hypothetical protein
LPGAFWSLFEQKIFTNSIEMPLLWKKLSQSAQGNDHYWLHHPIGSFIRNIMCTRQGHVLLG